MSVTYMKLLSSKLDAKDAEIEQLRADKEAISQTASDYLHDMEKLHQERMKLDHLIARQYAEIERLRTSNAELVEALKSIANITVVAGYPWTALNDAPILARVAIAKTALTEK